MNSAEQNQGTQLEAISNALDKTDVDSGAPIAGALTLSSEYYRAIDKPAPGLHVDAQYVKAVALSGGSEEEVVAQHIHICGQCEVRSTKKKVLIRVHHDISENIRSGEKHEANLAVRLRGERQYVETPSEAKHQPWTMRAKLLVAGMFILALVYLTAEVHNGMTFAMESGSTHLKHWWAAALFALVPCTAAGVFLKMISLHLISEQARRRFQLGLGLIGCTAGLLAVPFFAKTYAGFAASPIDFLTGRPVAAGTNPTVTIMLQILLCSLCSASLIIAAWSIIEQHCQPAKVESPAYTAIRRDLNDISSILRRDRELIGFVEGKLHQLESEQQRLAEDARQLFRTIRAANQLICEQAAQLMNASSALIEAKSSTKN